MSIIGGWQAEGVGEDERLVVQRGRIAAFDGEGKEIVQLRRSGCERESVFASHALPRNVGYLKWQKRRCDY